MDWTLFFKVWAGLFLVVIIAFYGSDIFKCLFNNTDCKLSKEDKEFLKELLDEAEKEEVTAKK